MPPAPVKKDTGNVEQPFRPPRQTAALAARRAEVSAAAHNLSKAAESWVRWYLGSAAVRSRLDPTLTLLSDDELFERLRWEFGRLPIIHNAPTDAANVADLIYMATVDDTTLNLSLGNGYLQNPCHRAAFGASAEPPTVAIYPQGYASMFVEEFGMPPTAYGPALTTSTANNCMLFNANNLRKTSGGNAVAYGGMTYVLNPATLDDRLFFEAWDGGNIETMHTQLNFSFPYPLGTRQDWFHLLQLHEALFNLPYPAAWKMPPSTPCCNYSIADIFNRWYVPGYPLPVSGMLISNPYFEVMSAGTVWLPEDVLYTVATFESSAPPLPGQPGAHIGLWGTQLGGELRTWSKTNGRPLIWVSSQDSAMLLDPAGGAIAGGRFTAEDVALFESQWTSASGASGFAALAALAPQHLHLHLPSWLQRASCEAIEADARNMVMGTDGNGNCVYWVAQPAPAASWELLNDGSCEPSTYPSRALYRSAKACAAAGAAKAFVCVEPATAGRRFCSPNATSFTAAGAASKVWPRGFGTMAACEAACNVTLAS